MGTPAMASAVSEVHLFWPLNFFPNSFERELPRARRRLSSGLGQRSTIPDPRPAISMAPQASEEAVGVEVRPELSIPLVTTSKTEAAIQGCGRSS